MNTLKNELSSIDYNNLATSSITSNAYAYASDLASDLNGIGITDTTTIQIIEGAAKGLGVVVHHTLEFTCTIEGETIPPNNSAPFFTFTVTRKDILTNLSLGVSTSGTAQTLQFTHVECQPPPTVTTSLEQEQFSNFLPVASSSYFAGIWAGPGEWGYSKVLDALGKSGVPLPIMDGFQFVFDQALLNIEQGYVGILADVKFTD